MRLPRPESPRIWQTTRNSLGSLPKKYLFPTKQFSRFMIIANFREAHYRQRNVAKLYPRRSNFRFSSILIRIDDIFGRNLTFNHDQLRRCESLANDARDFSLSPPPAPPSALTREAPNYTFVQSRLSKSARARPRIFDNAFFSRQNNQRRSRYPISIGIGEKYFRAFARGFSPGELLTLFGRKKKKRTKKSAIHFEKLALENRERNVPSPRRRDCFSRLCLSLSLLLSPVEGTRSRSEIVPRNVK